MSSSQNLKSFLTRSHGTTLMHKNNVHFSKQQLNEDIISQITDASPKGQLQYELSQNLESQYTQIDEIQLLFKNGKVFVLKRDSNPSFSLLERIDPYRFEDYALCVFPIVIRIIDGLIQNEDDLRDLVEIVLQDEDNISNVRTIIEMHQFVIELSDFLGVYRARWDDFVRVYITELRTDLDKIYKLKIFAPFKHEIQTQAFLTNQRIGCKLYNESFGDADSIFRANYGQMDFRCVNKHIKKMEDILEKDKHQTLLKQVLWSVKMRNLNQKISKPFIMKQGDQELRAQIHVIKTSQPDKYSLYLKEIVPSEPKDQQKMPRKDYQKNFSKRSKSMTHILNQTFGANRTNQKLVATKKSQFLSRSKNNIQISKLSVSAVALPGMQKMQRSKSLQKTNFEKMNQSLEFKTNVNPKANMTTEKPYQQKYQMHQVRHHKIKQNMKRQFQTRHSSMFSTKNMIQHYKQIVEQRRNQTLEQIQGLKRRSASLRSRVDRIEEIRKKSRGRSSRSHQKKSSANKKQTSAKRRYHYALKQDLNERRKSLQSKYSRTPSNLLIQGPLTFQKSLQRSQSHSNPAMKKYRKNFIKQNKQNLSEQKLKGVMTMQDLAEAPKTKKLRRNRQERSLSKERKSTSIAPMIISKFDDNRRQDIHQIVTGAQTLRSADDVPVALDITTLKVQLEKKEKHIYLMNAKQDQRKDANGPGENSKEDKMCLNIFLGEVQSQRQEIDIAIKFVKNPALERLQENHLILKLYLVFLQMNNKNLQKDKENKLSEQSLSLNKDFRFDQHNAARLMQFITTNFDGQLQEYLKLVLLMATTADSNDYKPSKSRSQSRAASFNDNFHQKWLNQLDFTKLPPRVVQNLQKLEQTSTLHIFKSDLFKMLISEQLIAYDLHKGAKVSRNNSSNSLETKLSSQGDFQRYQVIENLTTTFKQHKGYSTGQLNSLAPPSYQSTLLLQKQQQLEVLDQMAAKPRGKYPSQRVIDILNENAVSQPAIQMNDLVELKKQQKIELVQKYENFRKTHCKSASMDFASPRQSKADLLTVSIMAEMPAGQKLADQYQYEQRATEEEYAHSQPLSQVQSEIQYHENLDEQEGTPRAANAPDDAVELGANGAEFQSRNTNLLDRRTQSQKTQTNPTSSCQGKNFLKMLLGHASTDDKRRVGNPVKSFDSIKQLELWKEISAGTPKEATPSQSLSQSQFEESTIYQKDISKRRIINNAHLNNLVKNFQKFQKKHRQQEEGVRIKDLYKQRVYQSKQINNAFACRNNSLGHHRSNSPRQHARPQPFETRNKSVMYENFLRNQPLLQDSLNLRGHRAQSKYQRMFKKNTAGHRRDPTHAHSSLAERLDKSKELLNERIAMSILNSPNSYGSTTNARLIMNRTHQNGWKMGTMKSGLLKKRGITANGASESSQSCLQSTNNQNIILTGLFQKRSSHVSMRQGGITDDQDRYTNSVKNNQQRRNSQLDLPRTDTHWDPFLEKNQSIPQSGDNLHSFRPIMAGAQVSGGIISRSQSALEQQDMKNQVHKVELYSMQPSETQVLHPTQCLNQNIHMINDSNLEAQSDGRNGFKMTQTPVNAAKNRIISLMDTPGNELDEDIVHKLPSYEIPKNPAQEQSHEDLQREFRMKFGDSQDQRNFLEFDFKQYHNNSQVVENPRTDMVSTLTNLLNMSMKKVSVDQAVQDPLIEQSSSMDRQHKNRYIIQSILNSNQNGLHDLSLGPCPSSTIGPTIQPVFNESILNKSNIGCHLNNSNRFTPLTQTQNVQGFIGNATNGSGTTISNILSGGLSGTMQTSKSGSNNLHNFRDLNHENRSSVRMIHNAISQMNYITVREQQQTHEMKEPDSPVMSLLSEFNKN